MKWKDNPYLTITKDGLLDFMIESFHQLARDEAPFVSLKDSQDFIDTWVEKCFVLRKEKGEKNAELKQVSHTSINQCKVCGLEQEISIEDDNFHQCRMDIFLRCQCGELIDFKFPVNCKDNQMKIIPKDGYILVKKYIKAVIPGKIILSKEDSYNNWVVITSGNRENKIIQIKPFSKIPIEGNSELFLVKEEDILAYIEDKNELEAMV